MWPAGVGRGQDIVCNPGLDPDVARPHLCWTLTPLRGLEVFVRGKAGWQECNLYLGYVTSNP